MGLAGTYGVEDGAELSWAFRYVRNQISVRVVRSDRSDIRTVTLGKGAKVSALIKHCAKGRDGARSERGGYRFRANMCEAGRNRAAVLAKVLELKDGDIISWSVEGTKKRRRGDADGEEDEMEVDMEMAARPRKRQRIE